ncbi:MAG: PilW family protein [Gammaproteobacteria bacterium]|nr:PilW family protein [Gammaproteobacteria bacterium]MBI5615337.1 PilW family protein [Gammaproteobacteria bacterium]
MSALLHHRYAKPHRQQRGVTLIELMVAITVGLILLAGIIQLFVSNKKAYQIQEATNVLNENARYAADQIEYHLRMADHWAGAPTDQVTVSSGITTLPADCGSTGAVISAVGIKGFDGTGSSSPLTCIPNGDYVNKSDMIAIHYSGPLRVPDATVSTAGVNLFVRGVTGRTALIFEGQDFATIPANMTVAQDSGNPDLYANYTYNSVVYFVRKCASQDRGASATACDTGDDTTPTLARLVLTGNQLVQEDVIPGVEQMQVTYGVDLNADRAADRYDNAAAVTTANNWPNVVSVRLSLLVRSDEYDPNFTDAGTYRLYGGASGAGEIYTVPTADQHYHRRLFNFTIQIRNMTRG